MSYEIEFGDRSWEDAGGTVLHVLNDHHRILKGNGSAGLQTIVTELVSTLEAREEERKATEERRHKSNTLRLDLLLVLASIAALVLTAIGIVVGVALSHRSSLDFPEIFAPNSTTQTTAFERSPQIASE